MRANDLIWKYDLYQISRLAAFWDAAFLFGDLFGLCYTDSFFKFLVLSACMFADLLLPMFDDEYYPDILVAEVKQHVETFAKKIVKAKSEGDIYQYANATVAEINEMKPHFEDLDSSLDDSAADFIAEAMMMVVQDAGFMDIEMEELVVNREW